MLTKHAYINQAVHLAKVDKEVWIQPPGGGVLTEKYPTMITHLIEKRPLLLIFISDPF